MSEHVDIQTIFPPPGTKRNRRQRSLKGQLGGGDKKKGKGGKSNNSKDHEFLALEKSGAPPFLIKTYQMITTCDPNLAGWSDDGETFVVKDSANFAKVEIPKYFEHNNFSSFSRQLNFYGFRKVPNKAIRIDQYDKSSARYVRFCNDKFKQGRTDLLHQIQRSTKNNTNSQNHGQEIQKLREKVDHLETQLSDMRSEMANLQDQVQNLLRNNTISQNGANDYPNHESQQMNRPTDVPQAAYHYPALSKREQNGLSDNYTPQPSYSETQWENNTNPGIRDAGSAMLTPHPNTKQVDPTLLPPPPGGGDVNRNASLLRGFSEGFDGSLFTDEPEQVSSNGPPDVNQANMMARIQSLDISGPYNSNSTDDNLPPVDISPVGV